jgi:hypothetical protein
MTDRLAPPNSLTDVLRPTAAIVSGNTNSPVIMIA